MRRESTLRKYGTNPRRAGREPAPLRLRIAGGNTKPFHAKAQSSLRKGDDLFWGSVTDATLQRSVGLVAVFNLAMIVLISGRPSFSNASRPVRGITNPILAMEVVRNISEVDSVLGEAPSPDREVMRIKQYADFGFIGGYAALYVLMAMLLVGQGRTIAISAAAMGIIAALCDVIENLGILRVVDVDLAHTSQTMIDAVRYPSLVKWTLASLALGLLGFLAWRTGGVGLRIVGTLDLAAGLLGIGGVADNRLLQWLGLPMLAGLVGLAILYFRPRRHGRRQS
jgi:hypothetical protein